MLGFSLKISELQELPGVEKVTDAWQLRYLKYPEDLRTLLEGERVESIHAVDPWSSVLSLIEAVEANRGDEALLYSGGYPYILIARGQSILTHIADAPQSKHDELYDLLERDSLYLLEAWDQS